MRPDDQLASRIRSTKGSLTGRELLNRKNALPSARLCRLTCRSTMAAVYSRPAALKVSAEAVPAFRLAASSELMSAISISARNGSPRADCTVMRPKAKARASKLARLPIKAIALARAPRRQRTRLFMGFWASGVLSACNFILSKRTKTSMRIFEKQP